MIEKQFLVLWDIEPTRKIAISDKAIARRIDIYDFKDGNA